MKEGLKKGKKAAGLSDAQMKGKGIPGKVLILVCCVLLAALIIVLICVEAAVTNKLVISNKSNHKVTNLELWYEDETDGILLTKVLKFTDIDAKDKIVESIQSLELSKFSTQALLSIRIAFADGGEAEVQTSQILYDFRGKIQIEISDTSGEEVIIRMKAGEGLFNSSATTDCDDYYYINPKNGYIE